MPPRETVSLAQARERFPVLEEVNWMLDRVQEPIPIWGDVHQKPGAYMALDLHEPQENVTNITIVDGDLTLDEGLYFNENELVLCTGSVRAPRMEIAYVCGLVASGDVNVDEVHLHHGDDGGVLIVGGDLECTTFVATTYFIAEIKGTLRATNVFVDSTYAKDVVTSAGAKAINIDDAAAFVPDVLDGDGSVDCERILARTRQGLPVTR